MKFTYQSKTSGVFKSIQLDLEGTIKKGGVSMTYKLNKPENQNAGTFDIKVKKIKISDFYTAFSGKKMDSNPLVNDDYINGATIVDPTIKGSRSESGETEIIMTGREKSLFYRGGSRGFLGLAIKEKYIFLLGQKEHPIICINCFGFTGKIKNCRVLCTHYMVPYK